MDAGDLKGTWDRHMKAFEELDNEDPEHPVMINILQDLLSAARYVENTLVCE